MSEQATTNVDPDPWLTTNEVADHLNVHPATVRRWRADGTGPAYVLIGSRYRYRTSEITRYLEARTGGPQA